MRRLSPSGPHELGYFLGGKRVANLGEQAMTRIVDFGFLVFLQECLGLPQKLILGQRIAGSQPGPSAFGQLGFIVYIGILEIEAPEIAVLIGRRILDDDPAGLK